MTLFRAIALSLVLSSSAVAAAQTAAPTPPAAMPAADGTSRVAAEQPAGAYDLDPRHASVVWRVRHNGVGLFTARFDRIAGSLTFNPQNPSQSTIVATIEAPSVSTGVRNANNELAFDGEVASALGAAANPQIRFASTQIVATSDTTGLIQGDLTLNGVTRPVTLEASFHGGRFVALRQKQVLGFSARTLIRRSDFNITRWTPFVGDEVEILIDAEFVKA